MTTQTNDETLFANRVDEIHEFLKLHFADLRDDEVAELRVLGAGHPNSGYFTDLHEMAQSAAVLDEDGWAVYYGANPRSAPVARGMLNEMGSRRGGKVEDVPRRTWLILDVDAIRAVKGCATKVEKQGAKRRAVTIVKWLSSQGFGAPRLVDSGNGYHVLYSVALPTDSTLCEEVLQAVEQRHGVDMDSVFDAPRILRLPGTTNRKGENTLDRPHRLCKLVGGSPRVVPVDKLQAVAALAPQPKANKPAAKTAKATAKHETNGKANGQQTPKLLDPAVRRVAAEQWLDDQPAAVEGQGGDRQTFTVCCFLARDFALEWNDAWDLLLEYNQRCEPEWAEHDLERKLRDGFKKAEEEPDKMGRLVRKKNEKRSEYHTLVGIGRNGSELWCTPQKEPFATVEVDGHNEHYPVNSEEYADWLFGVHDECFGPPKDEPLNNACKALMRTARRKRKAHDVFLRVGWEPGVVWHDLCDEEWRAVRIDADGWRVESNPAVRFRRSTLLAPLPEPREGGDWAELREMVNVTDEDWPLFLAFLVGCFLPTGAYPILCPTGGPGAGKTFLTLQIQKLVDPQTKKMGKLKNNEDAQMILAENAWLQCYNNTSRISEDTSDNLCTLVEGAADVKRKLYTDKTISLTEAKRPIVLNGINLSAERSDLLDRAIPLDIIKPAKSDLEANLLPKYDALVPRFLACLYTAISCALRRFATTEVDAPPRMHDFAQWAVAAEDGLGLPTGAIIDALHRNSQHTTVAAAEASPLTLPLKTVLKHKGGRWSANATGWVAAIESHIKTPPKCCKNGTALGGQLNRDKAALAAVGIVAEWGREAGGNREKRWTIRLVSPVDALGDSICDDKEETND